MHIKYKKLPSKHSLPPSKNEAAKLLKAVAKNPNYMSRLLAIMEAVHIKQNHEKKRNLKGYEMDSMGLSEYVESRCGEIADELEQIAKMPQFNMA